MLIAELHNDGLPINKAVIAWMNKNATEIQLNWYQTGFYEVFS